MDCAIALRWNDRISG